MKRWAWIALATPVALPIVCLVGMLAALLIVYLLVGPILSVTRRADFGVLGMDDLAFFGLQWLIGVYAIATLAISAVRRRRRSWGRMLKRLGIALSLYVALLVANPYLLTLFPRPSVDTEADARTRLAALVKQRMKSASSVGDIERSIKNIKISGPSMTFDSSTTRYVSFTLDTGCGAPTEAMAVLRPRHGELLGVAPWPQNTATGCR